MDVSLKLHETHNKVRRGDSIWPRANSGKSINVISGPVLSVFDTSPILVPEELGGRKQDATGIISVSILSIWIAMISYGVVTLSLYDAIPSEATSALRTLPIEGSSGDPRNDIPLMLVFFHPHCPCSRTTVEQLQNLLIANHGALVCRVLFVIPPETERGWENGNLLRRVYL